VTGLVLLDRDGTINAEKHYLSSPDQLELLPNAAEGIRLLRRLGLPVVVVTNQSAIGRGYFDLARLAAIHRHLGELLAARGAALDAIFSCPHTPGDGCDCRKGAPGLARRAAEVFGGDLARSFAVGDKACDIELGKRVGATTILVRTGYGVREEAAIAATNRPEDRPDYVVADLREAARVIERLTVGERIGVGIEEGG